MFFSYQDVMDYNSYYSDRYEQQEWFIRVSLCNYFKIFTLNWIKKYVIEDTHSFRQDLENQFRTSIIEFMIVDQTPN